MFDTRKRDVLLQISKGIINNDELHIVLFLLSSTKINIKIDGTSSKVPFFGNIRTFQGDSSGPILFVVYLEQALRKVRKIRTTTTYEIKKILPLKLYMQILSG